MSPYRAGRSRLTADLERVIDAVLAAQVARWLEWSTRGVVDDNAATRNALRWSAAEAVGCEPSELRPLELVWINSRIAAVLGNARREVTP